MQQPVIEQEKEKSLVKHESQPSEKIEYEDDLSLGIEKDFPLSDSLKETAERLGAVVAKEPSKSVSRIICIS